MDFDNVKEKGSEYVEIGKELVGKAIEAGKKGVEFAQTNLEIARLESEIKKEKQKIGDVIYSNNISIENDIIKECIKNINELSEDLSALKSKNSKENA